MAATDMSPWTGNPYNRLPAGEVLTEDPEDIPDYGYREYLSLPGNPIYG